MTFNATFKHGGDGMGDVNRWRDKSEVNLPDKGFHYSICLLSINVTINNKTYPIFNEPEPNSIHSNKNIMQAVADENNKTTLTTLLVPLNSEMEFLKNKILSVFFPDAEEYFDFSVTLEATMFDEKMERARLGEEGTSSTYFCTVCH